MTTQTVTVYTTPGEYDEWDDIYIVFPSGSVMYCDNAMTIIEAMNSKQFEWFPSRFGEQHVRDHFEFQGYYPAPCVEQL